MPLEVAVVTTPVVDPTVAITGLLLVQVPTVEGMVISCVSFEHIVVGPLIGEGIGITVTASVDVQLVAVDV